MAFIPLGTIGGNIKEISLLAPKDIAVQLIHQFMRTGKAPALLHTGMDHAAREVFGQNFSGIPLDTDIAKTLIGKVGFVGFPPLTFENIGDGLLRPF